MKLLRLGLVASLALGCDPLPEDGDQQQMTSSPPSPVTSWPTFTGDCQVNWSDTVTAGNSNSVGDGSLMFNLEDTVPGDPGFQAWLMMTFDAADIGVPLSLDQQADKHIKIDYIVVNTTYQPYGDPGMIHGTVTVKRYQPPDIAEFEFSNATLVGEDSVYTGTYRCGINGTLTTTFAVTAQGTRCQTDTECGGARSGRVCDNSTFKCTSGCHVDEDCPVGHSCGTASSTCN
jgi:hypothetical protein